MCLRNGAAVAHAVPSVGRASGHEQGDRRDVNAGHDYFLTDRAPVAAPMSAKTGSVTSAIAHNAKKVEFVFTGPPRGQHRAECSSHSMRPRRRRWLSLPGGK